MINVAKLEQPAEKYWELEREKESDFLKKSDEQERIMTMICQRVLYGSLCDWESK